MGGGIYNEKYTKVISYDFKTKVFQKDDELVVIGEKRWGSNMKAIMKYMFLRHRRT
jgi:hypothetical protein